MGTLVSLITLTSILLKERNVTEILRTPFKNKLFPFLLIILKVPCDLYDCLEVNNLWLIKNTHTQKPQNKVKQKKEERKKRTKNKTNPYSYCVWQRDGFTYLSCFENELHDFNGLCIGTWVEGEVVFKRWISVFYHGAVTHLFMVQNI